MRFENVSVLVESILDVIKEVRYCWYVLSSSFYNYFRNYLFSVYVRLPQTFLKRMSKRAKMQAFSSLFCQCKRILDNLDMTDFRNRDRFRDLVHDGVRVRDRDRVRDIRGHK